MPIMRINWTSRTGEVKPGRIIGRSYWNGFPMWQAMVKLDDGFDPRFWPGNPKPTNASDYFNAEPNELIPLDDEAKKFLEESRRICDATPIFSAAD